MIGTSTTSGIDLKRSEQEIRLVQISMKPFEEGNTQASQPEETFEADAKDVNPGETRTTSVSEAPLERAIQALKSLNAIDLPLPFTSLPDELSALIGSVSNFPPPDISSSHEASKDLTPEQESSILHQLVQQLDLEGAHFKELHPSLVSAIADGKPTWIGRIPVFHLSPLLYILAAPLGSAGVTFSITPIIFTRLPHPTRRETIHSLLWTGTLPEYFAILHHEWIHTQQIKSSRYLLNLGVFTASWTGFIMSFYRRFNRAEATIVPFLLLAVAYTVKYLVENHMESSAYKLLREVHAYEAITASTAPILGWMEDKNSVLEMLLSNSLYTGTNEATVEAKALERDGVDDKQDRKRRLLGQALDAIRNLRLLGVDHLEICRHIQMTRPDAKARGFEHLDVALAFRRAQLELSDQATYDVVIEALESKLDLNRVLLRWRTQALLQEAILSHAAKAE